MGLLIFFPWRESPSGLGPPVCRGLNHHTVTHHTRQDSSIRVISPTQRPPRDNTQKSQETDMLSPGKFEATITSMDLLQAHTLDCAGLHILCSFCTQTRLLLQIAGLLRNYWTNLLPAIKSQIRWCVQFLLFETDSTLFLYEIRQKFCFISCF